MKSPVATSYELIADQAALERAALALAGAEVLALDTETTALNPRDGQARLLQLSAAGTTLIVDLFLVRDLTPLKPLLEDGPVKVLHNAKFDYAFLKAELGISIYPIFDTMLASQLLEGGEQGPSHSLAAAAFRFLGIRMDKTAQMQDWSGELSTAQLDYAARDVAILLPLHSALKEALRQERLTVAAKIEFGAVGAIAEMELAGIKLDASRWRELESRVRARRDEVSEELESLLPQADGVLPLEGAGMSINLNSPQQVTDALRALGLDLPDSREWTLSKIDHPAAKLLLEYRELQKKLGTYLQTYANYIHPKTGRIHASFSQCRVPTGRLACSNPNIQQVPGEDEFRRCFRAEEGNTLIIADYSQIELRILAEVSEDPGFVQAFQRGEDLHSVTAATMFGIPREQVTKEQRSAAKSINFGLVYGRGPKSLSVQLGTDEQTARRLIEDYFASYPEVRSYLHGTAQRALNTRTLRTLAGRVRKFGEVAGRSRAERAALRREAMNFPIQGTSADITKLAFIQLRRDLRGLDARIVNSIHDEFVVECREEQATQTAHLVQQAMVTAGKYILKKVPVEVEVVISKVWKK